MKHFGKYGDIVDSVIMKDRHTQQPRGFGFITYVGPSIVDQVIKENHIINGKQVEIKRTIPKGSAQSKDFKTKNIFVGGIPSFVTSNEFKSFFSKYGMVVEHEIITDHVTKRSRGFGFVIFDSEKVVDELYSKGNMIEIACNQVSSVLRVISLSYRGTGGLGTRVGGYGGGGAEEFGGGGYGGFGGGGSLGGYRGVPSIGGYSRRLGSYGGAGGFG
ncbi:Heterogeneous nuclear ribonucleoprotein 1 [Platanthera zijinensis]|uniref:Heterogeneous nuclear ribonucleoprotein 1 n=1 Tax=Platanthera zijinensis TaxID=2320716 RepID=A0AAP0G0R4_9ASPA